MKRRICELLKKETPLVRCAYPWAGRSGTGRWLLYQRTNLRAISLYRVKKAGFCTRKWKPCAKGCRFHTGGYFRRLRGEKDRVLHTEFKTMCKRVPISHRAGFPDLDWLEWIPIKIRVKLRMVSRFFRPGGVKTFAYVVIYAHLCKTLKRLTGGSYWILLTWNCGAVPDAKSRHGK